MIKLAINGYGRIGRSILRSLYYNQTAKFKELEIVAINDVGDPKVHAHLTKYDSNCGKFRFPLKFHEDQLIIDRGTKVNTKIQMLAIAEPKDLPWKELGVDLVLECTGKFTNRETAGSHLIAGAKKVLISAPSGNDVITIVYGINHHKITANDRIISNASCTTNCLAPLVLPLHKNLEIESGLMTTIHAYTNDQVLTDSYHNDLRRARAAPTSIIPTSTGAARVIGMVIPELNNKLKGLAIRVPTANVSLVDLTVMVKRETSVDEVNSILRAANLHDLAEITEINELPLVSIDFNQHSASSIFDLTQTMVIGKLVKVLAWYDNEWGFANRMLDTALIIAKL